MSCIHKLARAAALLCLPLMASAAPTSVSALAAASALDSSFLAGVVRQVPLVSPLVNVPSSLQVGTLINPPLGNLSGSTDLLIFNFSALVRSHQERRAFALIDRAIMASHLSDGSVVVSAVPLPGVMWLFVISVMGLAGTRVTGIKRTPGAKAGGCATGDQRPAFGCLGAPTPA